MDVSPEEFSGDFLSDILSSAGLEDLSMDDIHIGPLILPADSETKSDVLALQLSGLCSAQDADQTKQLFLSSGIELLTQNHYDKDPLDPSHTCAWSLGKGFVFQGMLPRNALLVSIRGTYAGEWYSNFDFNPSYDEDFYAAENFLYAASDIFLDLKKYMDEYRDSLIIICGHSRGGACANLLGVLVNEYTDPSNVYVYTYASPKTLRSEHPAFYSSNIFNFINAADIVPMLPFEVWGFERAGNDVFLSQADPQSDNERYIRALSDLAPTIHSYYFDRHAINESGLSETGLTSFETMLMLSDLFINRFYRKDSGSAHASDTQNILSSISDRSDLTVLSEIFLELSENDYEKAENLLIQHLPTTYLELLGYKGE